MLRVSGFREDTVLHPGQRPIDCGPGLDAGQMATDRFESCPRLMKQITLNGVKHHVDVCGPIDGCVDTNNSTVPTIMLCRDLGTRAGLETAIHEAMHKLHPMMSEARVERSANDMARFLWVLGYQHQKHS
jgi:hypothetical protein